MNEEFFKSVFDLMDFGVYIVDEKFDVVYTNSFINQIHNQTNGQLRVKLGNPITALCENIDHSVFKEYATVLKNGESINVEKIFSNKFFNKRVSITRKKLNFAEKNFVVNFINTVQDYCVTNTFLSEALLDSIFNNDTFGAAILNSDFKFENVNNKLAEILEVEKHQIVEFPDITNKYYCEKNIEIASGIFNGYISNYMQEILLNNKNSNDSWRSIIYIPIAFKGEKADKILLLFLDISERKFQEEELRRNELEKNVILDALEEGVVYLDLNRNLIWSNRAANSHSGSKIECLTGENCYKIWNNNSECTACPTIMAIESGKPEKCSIKSSDGKEWIVQALPVKKDSGELIGIVEVRYDVTDIIKAQEHLENSRKILRQVIDLVPHAIYAKNLNGDFVLANENFANYYNLTPEELVGKNQLEIHPIKSEVKQFFDQDREIIFQNKKFELIEDRVTLENGQLRFFETSKIPFQIIGSDEKAVLGVSIDISEKKDSERRKIQSQKMEAVGRLALGISHDFNNLLTSILGNAELLKLISTEDKQEFNKRVDNIKNAAIKAGETTRRLIDFGKNAVSSPIEYKINQVINDIYKIASRAVGENKTINLNLSNDLNNLVGDPGQIGQVIMNLIVNASDAISNGGIISVSTYPIVITESYKDKKPGNYIAISVKDNGAGIKPDLLDKIFDPFFTTKTDADNPGMGLSLVYGIVKRHNGFIEVFSEPNLGSNFIIYLPTILKSEINLIEDKENYTNFKGIGEHVLVLEDDFHVRDAIVQTLKTNGYKVYETSRYSEAVEVLEKSGSLINVAIIDTILPDSNGINLSDLIFENYSNIYSIIITGQVINAELEEKIKERNMGFFEKPFELSKLLKSVKLGIKSLNL